MIFRGYLICISFLSKNVQPTIVLIELTVAVVNGFVPEKLKATANGIAEITIFSKYFLHNAAYLLIEICYQLLVEYFL